MIRIGDFSKLSRVSVKTLRFYDDMGLLKPVHVDRWTSYRYYEFHQLSRLYRILALKDLGFSLEDVGRFLDSDLSSQEIRGMLKLRQADIRQRMAEETGRLERVAIWLRHIEQEDAVSTYDVVLKRIDVIKVASVRDVVPTPPDQGPMWGELLSWLGQNNARMNGTPMAVYHDPEAKERDWDIEVCMPIEGDVPENERVKVHTLPATETMACVVHNGSFATIGHAYDALAKWMDDHGYRIVGPSRELNLRMPAKPGDQNDPDTVNEIQFPVAKA